MTERITLVLTKAEANAVLAILVEAEAGGYNEGEMLRPDERRAADRAIVKLRAALP